ncbi:hypothetical protein [Marinobacter fonticola]|uniref:hypothetical protein n=1 Tax=Marinobacter fonticola TaxID=2603215 RepID=UPI001D0DB6D9|nr:hypothetical protein [Marinobacter fonticola]
MNSMKSDIGPAAKPSRYGMQKEDGIEAAAYGNVQLIGRGNGPHGPDQIGGP